MRTKRPGSRVVLVVVAAATLFGGTLEAQVTGSAESRSCGNGGSSHPGLGIGTFHCQGGSCLVRGVYSTLTDVQRATVEKILRNDSGAWDFSTEPRLWQIDPRGPSEGHVQEGDVLVAVDGAPITTREAGRRLEAMKVGTPLELTLRRKGVLVRVSVTPAERCQAYRVSAGPDSVPPYMKLMGGVLVPLNRVDQSLSPIPTGVGRVRFVGAGLVLAAATEIQVAADGSTSWRFLTDPVVAEIPQGSEAGRLGIVPGEVIVQAGSDSLTSAEGVAALAAARPGHPVMLFVGRGHAYRQVELYGKPEGGRER